MYLLSDFGVLTGDGVSRGLMWLVWGAVEKAVKENWSESIGLRVNVESGGRGHNTYLKGLHEETHHLLSLTSPLPLHQRNPVPANVPV